MSHAFPPRRSSDLVPPRGDPRRHRIGAGKQAFEHCAVTAQQHGERAKERSEIDAVRFEFVEQAVDQLAIVGALPAQPQLLPDLRMPARSEEHTSELQSLMRNSYSLLRLKKK